VQATTTRFQPFEEDLAAEILLSFSRIGESGASFGARVSSPLLAERVQIRFG
jgi:hypothetical protein